QRIKGLSLTSAVLNAVLPKKKPKNRGEVIKTLIDTFRYPRKGPGMMWERCTEKIREQGGEVRMGRKVTGAVWDPAKELWSVECETADGSLETVEARHLVSSAPLRELARSLEPRLSDRAIAAADALRYRDFLTVVVVMKDKELFDDN